MLRQLRISTRKGSPPKNYPLGVRREHTGRLTYNDERNQARFDRVFIQHAIMEIEAVRGGSTDGTASSPGALEARSIQGAAFKSPQLEERQMNAELPVRRDDEWFDDHLSQLRRILREKGGEELRHMRDEVRRQEEEGTLIIGVPQRRLR